MNNRRQMWFHKNCKTTFVFLQILPKLWIHSGFALFFLSIYLYLYSNGFGLFFFFVYTIHSITHTYIFPKWITHTFGFCFGRDDQTQNNIIHNSNKKNNLRKNKLDCKHFRRPHVLLKVHFCCSTLLFWYIYTWCFVYDLCV